MTNQEAIMKNFSSKKAKPGSSRGAASRWRTRQLSFEEIRRLLDAAQEDRRLISDGYLGGLSATRREAK
jgi:hypothetical protein